MKALPKKMATLGLVVLCAISFCACENTVTEVGIPSKASSPEVITEVKTSNGETISIALDIGTYVSFDEEYALNLMETKYAQNIAKGGCTCVVKDRSDEGDGILIGRNMDLSLSDKPLYMFQLDYGTYKAMGIAYDNKAGPTIYEAKNGLGSSEDSQEFLKFLPLVASDYMNEAGLYIEMNMRNMDYGENPETDYQESKYGCDGTNPGKGLPNVYLASVPFYVSTRCATVEEVLNLIQNDINIYTLTTTEEQYMENGAFGTDWNFAFVVADAEGNCGLIEIADNQIVYTPGYGQTNFYRSDDFAEIEVYPTGGWGKRPSTDYTACDNENVAGAFLDDKKCRYAVAYEDIDSIETVSDMQQNMRKVFYSQVYSDKANGLNSAISDYESSVFNPRYEMIQCFPLVSTGDGPDDWALDFDNGNKYKCTFDVITGMSQDKFQELFQEYCRYHYAEKTKAQLMADNEDYWISSHSVVVDIDNKTWTITFFEGTESFEFSI